MRRKIIESFLDQLFPHPKIPLAHEDAYTLLIATILSAQCSDHRVNQVTKILFSEANTPSQMTSMPITKIEKIIRPCGLYKRKALAIKKTSQILVTQFSSKVPRSFTSLESLPGVGHKTASCIMSQSFQQPAFPIDTHIYRCAHRWDISSSRSIKGVEKDMKSFFLKKNWQKRHLQIIYYARKYCPALKHNIQTCFICSALQQHSLTSQ